MAQITGLARSAALPLAPAPAQQLRARSTYQAALTRPASFVPKPVPFRSAARSVAVKAKELDFDEVLADLNDKFEKSENKPVVIGYAVGAVGAVFFAEWLIHLPLFNVLLGFPIQLLGLSILPYLYVRYATQGEDWAQDTEDAANAVIAQLPGLGKK